MKALHQIAALFLLGAGCFLTASAQNTDWATRKRSIKNYALTLSSGQDSLSYSYFSLGVTGHYNQLKGLGINLLANHSDRDMSGLMVSGMLNMAGGNSSGLAVGAVANVSGRNMNGLHLGGLMNIGGKDMNGLQFSTIGNISGRHMNGFTTGVLLNISGENANGIALSGIANVIGTHQNGVAVSGLINVAGENTNGLQVAGLSNISGGTLRGLQVAPLLNVAGCNKGVQLGVVNVAGALKGVQIGLLNCSMDTVGHKIGLVNINPATRYQLMVFGGNMSKFNVAARFKNRHTYTILGIGSNYLDFDHKYSADVFYRAGAWLPLGKRWEISADGGFMHIETFKNDHNLIPKRMYSLQTRLNLEYRASRKLGIFASGGYGWTRHYDADICFEKKAIAEIGIVLF